MEDEAGLEALLNEMKGQGFGGAVIRKDGVLVYSTLAVSDVSANLISSVANISHALMKRTGDEPENMELVFRNLILILVPVRNHVFCGAVNDRKDKPVVLNFAKRAEACL